MREAGKERGRNAGREHTGGVREFGSFVDEKRHPHQPNHLPFREGLTWRKYGT